MRQTIITLVALVLAVGFASVQAKASASGSIGCGGGNGAVVPCNGQGLGTVTLNSDGSVDGTVDVALTSVSGLPSSVSGLQVFTPNADQFEFAFTNVNYSFNQGGTFSFTDLTEIGLLTVSGQAEYLSYGAPTNLVGDLDMVLSATSYTFAGNSGTFSTPVGGTVSLVLDPGNVMSMTGSVGLPSIGGSGPSATPEPGTLLLLASGLAGIGFIGRKLVVCG